MNAVQSDGAIPAQNRATSLLVGTDRITYELEMLCEADRLETEREPRELGIEQTAVCGMKGKRAAALPGLVTVRCARQLPANFFVRLQGDCAPFVYL